VASFRLTEYQKFLFCRSECEVRFENSSLASRVVSFIQKPGNKDSVLRIKLSSSIYVHRVAGEENSFSNFHVRLLFSYPLIVVINLPYQSQCHLDSLKRQQHTQDNMKR
jgi:hypothetical protein